MTDIDPVDEWEQAIRAVLINPVAAGFSSDARVILAGNALDSLLSALRVERERAEENRAGWDVAKMANSRYARQADDARAELRDATSVLHLVKAERDVLLIRAQQAEEALVRAGIVLEVLSGQIRTKPYVEMTNDFQDEIQRVTLVVRGAVLASSVSSTEEER